MSGSGPVYPGGRKVSEALDLRYLEFEIQGGLLGTSKQRLPTVLLVTVPHDRHFVTFNQRRFRN